MGSQASANTPLRVETDSDMTDTPRAVFGVAAHNHAADVRESIESILGQTSQEFAVVIVDDCSTDDTGSILREYAAAGSRVHYFRNERRVGVIENWRRIFERARELFPGAEFFAWGSDHDLWHPRWLSVLLRTLDEHPDAILAYPLNTKVFADGSPVDRKPWHFDTADVTSPDLRVWRTTWSMSAGNMIYGLFRIGPLERAGVFRHILLPDRMLLAELSVFGSFRQVDEILWFRRWYGRQFSVERQRVVSFPYGRPFHVYLPWSLSHAGALAWNLVMGRHADPSIGFWTALRLSFVHLAAVIPTSVTKALRVGRSWLRHAMPRGDARTPRVSKDRSGPDPDGAQRRTP